MNDRDKKFLIFAFGVGVIAFVPFLVFPRFPVNDFASQFGPMIRSFVDGEWHYAFDPYLPPLHVVCSGVLAWTGLDAYPTSMMAMGGFHLLGILPVFFLFRLTHGFRIAAWATILYVLCPRLIRYGGKAVMDPMVCFFLAVGVCALFYFFYQKGTMKHAALTGFAAGGLVLAKEESVLWAVLLLVALVACAFWVGRQRAFPVGKKALTPLLGVGICLLMISPWLTYMYARTGYPVASLRHVEAVKKLKNELTDKEVSHENAEKMEPNTHGVDQRRPPSHQGNGQVQRLLCFSEHNLKLGIGNTENNSLQHNSQAMLFHSGTALGTVTEVFVGTNWEDVLENIFDGFYHVYLLFAAAGIVLIVRRGHWNSFHHALLFCVIGYLGIHFILRLMLSIPGATDAMTIHQRHVAVAIPFILGWTATGIVALYDKLVNLLEKRGYLLQKGVFTMLFAALLWDGYVDIRPSLDASERKQKKAIQDCAQWLRTEGMAMVPDEHPRLQERLSRSDPVFGELPIVIGGAPAISYFAEAERIGVSPWAHPPEKQDERSKKYHANFFIWDEAVRDSCQHMVKNHAQRAWH